MERTWRWFGKKDKITLAQLKQIGATMVSFAATRCCRTVPTYMVPGFSLRRCAACRSRCSTAASTESELSDSSLNGLLVKNA